MDILKDIFNMTFKEWIQGSIFAVMVYGGTFIFMVVLELYF